MKQAVKQTKPLARKEGLVIQELPDEVLVYDLDRDRAHCLNDTAAFVWQHCDGRTTTGEIARSLGTKVNAPVDEKVVWFAIDQLKRNHLMTSTPVPPQLVAGMGRRAMMRALGVAAVVAVPVVTSILAPTPAQAITCLANGAPCTLSAQCCSNLCTANVCV